MEVRVQRAALVLRGGLAAVFLYAAVAALVRPADWIIFLPHIVTQIVPAVLALKLFSSFELVLALWLFSGRYIRYAAGLAALTMVGIMVSDAQLLAITFRDIAIACAAVALAILEY